MERIEQVDRIVQIIRIWHAYHLPHLRRSKAHDIRDNRQSIGPHALARHFVVDHELRERLKGFDVGRVKLTGRTGLKSEQVPEHPHVQQLAHLLKVSVLLQHLHREVERKAGDRLLQRLVKMEVVAVAELREHHVAIVGGRGRKRVDAQVHVPCGEDVARVALVSLNHLADVPFPAHMDPLNPVCVVADVQAGECLQRIVERRRRTLRKRIRLSVGEVLHRFAELEVVFRRWGADVDAIDEHPSIAKVPVGVGAYDSHQLDRPLLVPAVIDTALVGDPAGRFSHVDALAERRVELKHVHPRVVERSAVKLVLDGVERPRLSRGDLALVEGKRRREVHFVQVAGVGKHAKPKIIEIQHLVERIGNLHDDDGAVGRPFVDHVVAAVRVAIRRHIRDSRFVHVPDQRLDEERLLLHAQEALGQVLTPAPDLR